MTTDVRNETLWKSELAEMSVPELIREAVRCEDELDWKGHALVEELESRLVNPDEDDLVDAVLDSRALKEAVEQCLESVDSVEQDEFDELEESVSDLEDKLADKADAETLRDLAERVTVDCEEPLEELHLRVMRMEQVMRGGFFSRLRWLLTGK